MCERGGGRVGEDDEEELTDLTSFKKQLMNNNSDGLIRCTRASRPTPSGASEAVALVLVVAVAVFCLPLCRHMWNMLN